LDLPIEGRKDGGKEGWREGKDGGKEGWREGRMEARKDGPWFDSPGEFWVKSPD
jgi:hypothetical protein